MQDFERLRKKRYRYCECLETRMVSAYMQQSDEQACLGDAALHDEEVRVVDVELHRVEQALHPAAAMERNSAA